MIGIIGFANLRIMQYLDKYVQVLDNMGIEYEVIYWNREQDEEQHNFKGNAIAFNLPLNTYQNFRKKINAFIKYANFLYKIIKKKKYDKLIVLTSQTAVPLSYMLFGKYKEKYIYDYRDITKEKRFIYKKLVQRLLKCSYFTAISSNGFKEIIGDSDKLVLSHNCNDIKMEEVSFAFREPINIVFWGIIRNYEFNKKICDIFGNDKRFTLTYHGDGNYKLLEKYCEEKRYTNISFTGKYFREQIREFVDNTDILHCMYPNDMQTKPTLAVKLYDAIRYCKPILFNKNSYVAEYAKTYGVGLDVDIDSKNLADDVYNWYNQINIGEHIKNYNNLLDAIKEDDEKFEKKLKLFLEK